MLLLPKDTFEKLEFDKVLELVRKACLGALGVDAVKTIRPESNMVLIQAKLEEVAEYKLNVEEEDSGLPMASYRDISEELKHLEVENYVLPEEGLQKINGILRLLRGILKFFTSQRRAAYGRL